MLEDCFNGGSKHRHDDGEPHSRIIHKYKKLAPKPDIYEERYLKFSTVCPAKHTCLECTSVN